MLLGHPLRENGPNGTMAHPLALMISWVSTGLRLPGGACYTLAIELIDPLAREPSSGFCVPAYDRDDRVRLAPGPLRVLALAMGRRCVPWLQKRISPRP